MAGPELRFENFLGKGSFGSVSLYRYTGRRDGKTLYAAAKTSDYKHAESLYREFQILSELRGCPRIVQCYGTKVQERLNEQCCLEYKFHMEYAPGGSLKSFATQFKDKKFPDALVRDFTRMLLEGLADIHGRGYVHCDLKPGNILVFPSYDNKNSAWRSLYDLKISDFGLTRRDGDTSWWQPHHPFAGTAIYMSPESISHGQTGKGLDLWSLGCIVLEMYTGKKPWWHKDHKREDLKNCQGPLIPRDLPLDARLFLMTCFSPEADDRKDASSLLSHVFLRCGEVSKITESSPMNVKTGMNPRKITTMDLEKLRQRLSDMRSYVF